MHTTPPRPPTPPQVFEVDHGKSWRAVLISLVSFAASLYLIHISPWYLLPFAWALSGTAFTGVRPRTAALAHGARLRAQPAWAAARRSVHVARARSARSPRLLAPLGRSGSSWATTAGTAASTRTTSWRTLWAP